MSKATAAVIAWRWLSGHPLDGRYRTNATWTMPSRGDKPVIGHPTGHVVRWHHMPRLHRAGIRTGSTALFLAVTYGLWAAFWLTAAMLAAAFAAVAAYAAKWLCRRIPQWRHRRRYVRPLRRALTPALGAPPTRLEIEPDRSRVIIGVPVEFTGSEREREAITRAVTTKLMLDGPDLKWELHARRPQVTFTQSEPPPFPVAWEDVAASVRRAAPKELVFGVGKRGVIATASYGDSPHLAIPGGSGGGKSNLAAFLLLQELMRGTLIFNLDPKWISHLWLQDLPNVINAHDTEDLHLALCWLGRELKRRTKAAYYSAGGTGRVRGSVGARYVVLAEELNYGMPDLKDLWTERRAQDKSLPKKSPAIAALSALSCAGRASDIHMWLVAQLLTVESTGVRDSTIRTNAGIKAMIARLDKPGWDMAVGKHVPMPSPSIIPGRIHLVTGGEPPRETQVPYLHLDDEDDAVAEQAVRWARQLAVSGTVASIPGGPGGIPSQLWPASVLRREPLAIEAGQGTGTPRTVIPPADLTIAEAVEDGIFGERNLGAARRRVNRAGIEPTGERGDGSFTYARAALAAAARNRRGKDAA